MQGGHTVDSSCKVIEAVPLGTSERSAFFDPPSGKEKLDVQWMKGIWIDRLDENDGRGAYSAWNRHWTSVRRLAGNLRVPPDLVGKEERDRAAHREQTE